MSLISVFSPRHNVIINVLPHDDYNIRTQNDDNHNTYSIVISVKNKSFSFDIFKTKENTINVLKHINNALSSNLDIQIEIDEFDKISVKVGVDKYEINFKND